ncbi:hypothetical protein KAW38_04875 [Candidatus Micrarchaeota archaeon]|nr:hypothetical protein [Candidatus Micrarchaeota archaeon]
MNPEVYNSLNKEWKSTCRIVLRGEVGELDEFSAYLSEYPGAMRSEKSHISNKTVFPAQGDYCPSARFMDLGEIDYSRKFEPLNINEIKDIDSLVESLQERFVYAGNIILGNSRFVSDSSDIHNSSFILDSLNILDSIYMAHVKMARSSERIFGGNGIGESKFNIMAMESTWSSRCFEFYESHTCSDCYYVMNINGCQDCIFSFNLKNKKYTIGNLELEKSQYMKIKESLLEEIRAKLVKDRKCLGLLDYLYNSRVKSDELKNVFSKITAETKYDDPETDISVVQDQFEDTCKVVFGRPIGSMEDYSDFLYRHVKPIEILPSVISGKESGLVHYSVFDKFPHNRIIRIEEGQLAGKYLKADKNDVNNLSLEKAHDIIADIGYVSTELKLQNSNIPECVMVGYSSNSYRCGAPLRAKNCGYSFWPVRSENMFGVDTVHDSLFCINVYNSSKLSRCFEVDSSRDCSDIYFSHNCEAVQDGMFCFNVKNLKHAIGNSKLSPDEYRKIKSSLLEQISSELEKNKTLKYDIYNIGCK